MDKVIIEIIKPHYSLLSSSSEIVSLNFFFFLMAGHLLFNSGLNESSLAPPFKWLDNTFQLLSWDCIIKHFFLMAGLTEFYCGWNEPSHASQFKWLEYTFNVSYICCYLKVVGNEKEGGREAGYSLKMVSDRGDRCLFTF